MTSSSVKHPILRLEVLAPDGTRQAESRVFCRLQRRSVMVDTCCSCVHCDAISDGPIPTVDCSIPVKPLDIADDPEGEQMEVGALLCTGTMAIAQSAPVGIALELLRAERTRAVAVVDDGRVLVGLLHETVFIGHRPRARHSEISTAMSTAIAVHERTPVRMALRLLAANHLREVTVVSDDGTPIGLFKDVDGLHWIAVARGYLKV